MPGLNDAALAGLLRGLSPRLWPGEYVLLCLPKGRYGDAGELAPVGAFAEDEGLTLVVERGRAEAAGHSTGPVLRMLTLGVYSSLEDVGLTAAVATVLAGAGISANMIAAFHHDHLLVPAARADEALGLLDALAREARAAHADPGPDPARAKTPWT